MPTAIEWSDETWNPYTGCTKVSAGCKNCYMFREYPRLTSMGVPGYEYAPDQVQVHGERLDHPRLPKKPKRIFVNSMSDTFHEDVGVETIEKVFGVFERYPQHHFQVLTKRADRMYGTLCGGWPKSPCSGPIADHRIYQRESVWLGVSVENQAAAHVRIPWLLKTPAAIRWLSVEPLIGPVDLTGALDLGLDWVVVGGESGPGARPMDLDWARAIRDQCAEANVPFFLKQLGGERNKRGGVDAVLDGRLHTDFPLPHPAREAMLI